MHKHRLLLHNKCLENPMKSWCGRWLLNLHKRRGSSEKIGHMPFHRWSWTASPPLIAFGCHTFISRWRKQCSRTWRRVYYGDGAVHSEKKRCGNCGNKTYINRFKSMNRYERRVEPVLPRSPPARLCQGVAGVGRPPRTARDVRKRYEVTSGSLRQSRKFH